MTPQEITEAERKAAYEKEKAENNARQLKNIKDTEKSLAEILANEFNEMTYSYEIHNTYTPAITVWIKVQQSISEATAKLFMEKVIRQLKEKKFPPYERFGSKKEHWHQIYINFVSKMPDNTQVYSDCYIEKED